ncbi:hypothetical protein EVJ58_g6430 [Rhodofomes roseus]|uniref:Uncharacterized protein n=1 Tax=Rhodofomes roseus TaxID=34475 RepID=A0A4Y9Y8B7_9APHY|nr:hypothetical protein EVJ58_g6430 [Rhodofomes roseus]
MLQHYHAAVPPPVQPGSDGMVQGWTSGDPQAAGKVRVCETSGCSTVLSAKHLWRVCSRCLAAADPGHFAAVPSKRGREKSMDASASASPSASAGAEVAASDELNKPRLRVAMQASASSASETPPTEPHHHVFPLSASSQTSPSVQVPIARSRRSASVELVVSPGVNPGPRNQPPISIPSLFSQPISQNARTKHRQTSSLTNALGPSHFPNHAYPLQDPLTSNGQGAFDQKPDTDAMLEQLESLVREHVGVARIPTLTPDAVRAQHSAERIRGGAGSSPVGVPPKPVEPSPQPQVRSVPLPLPRKMKNIAGPSKATASESPAADQPFLLDDDGDVPMLPEPPTQAVEPTATSRNETENGGSTDADVVMSDVNTNAEPTHSLDPHTQGPFRDVAINNAPARAEPGQLTVPVKAEQATEPSFTTVAEHDEDVRMSPEPVAGDTSEEDEPPLSVVVKSKRDMENTDEEKPVARINLKFKTTTPSTYRSQSTPKTGSTPLRIRIPSFKKSSPPRVDVSLAPPSTPPIPESLAAPSSPTSPTQPTTGVNTPWDSDLSDLTPIEDLTDEGESEIGEPEDDAEEKPKLKIKLKIPKSLQGSKGRPVRLVPSRKEDKSPSTCNIRRCQNMLAPGYRYKMCDICREHNRVGQRRMRAAEKADDPYAKSKKHLVDLSGYPPGSRICVGKWCKTVVPPESEYKWKMCVACRQAYRKQDNYAAIFEHPALLNGKKQTREGDGLDFELQYPDDDDDGFPYVDRTPNAYQHLGDLLQMLERRFHAFFVAQLQYYQFKIGRGVDVTAATPSMFSFTGEYSIVANPAGGTVNEAVKALASQVEGALGIRFNPAGIFMGPEASVVSRFGCVHEVNMPFPQVKSEPSAPDTPAPVLVRRMAGELEIDVSWDRRHKYFPGQRIQIRFKLLS